MLSPKYLSEVAVSVIKLYENVEDEILKDIARRIKKASKVTETAQRQMEVLIENGYSYQDLQTKLKPYLENIDKEISKVLDESTIKHYDDEKKAYEKVNKHLVDYTKNDRANKINRQIKDELVRNNKILTNSLGFAYDGKAYTIDNFYRKELNKNILLVSSGAFDRESATRKLINTLGDSGVKSINYNKSGRNYSIESASKMLIRTAVSQLTGEISLMNANDMGQDLMEISAHIGARPSHAVWQGKIVSLSGTNSKYLTLEDIGYGEVTGFKGANCKHDWYPFFEGISERIYDDEDLEDLDPEGFEFEGKEYNYYKATQKQRQIERSIRKYKQKVMMFDEVGDSEAKLANQVRLQRQRKLYKDFNKAGKLREKTSNINVYGYSRSKASKEVWAVRKLNQTLYGDYLGTKNYKDADKIVNRIKDNNQMRLLEGFKKAVDKGDISVLVGIDRYIEISKEIDDKLVGITTKDGIKIKEYGTHFIDRVIGQHAHDDIPKKGMRRGVDINEIKESLLNPNKIKFSIVKNEERNQYINSEVKVTLDIDRGRLIQTSQNKKRR